MVFDPWFGFAAVAVGWFILKTGREEGVFSERVGVVVGPVG